jgi:hypothetical protein
MLLASYPTRLTGGRGGGAEVHAHEVERAVPHD